MLLSQPENGAVFSFSKDQKALRYIRSAFPNYYMSPALELTNQRVFTMGYFVQEFSGSIPEQGTWGLFQNEKIVRYCPDAEAYVSQDGRVFLTSLHCLTDFSHIILSYFLPFSQSLGNQPEDTTP